MPISLSQVNSSLGVLFQQKQTGTKSINASAWTTILSLTLSPGTYIILGQLNITGSSASAKYIALTDASMIADYSINFALRQLYSQVVGLFTITTQRTVNLAAYSQSEAATVSKGSLIAMKIK